MRPVDTTRLHNNPQALPAWPFLAATPFIGVAAVAPYLALFWTRPAGGPPRLPPARESLKGRWRAFLRAAEGRALPRALLAGAAALALLAAAANNDTWCARGAAAAAAVRRRGCCRLAAPRLLPPCGAAAAAAVRPRGCCRRAAPRQRHPPTHPTTHTNPSPKPLLQTQTGATSSAPTPPPAWRASAC